MARGAAGFIRERAPELMDVDDDEVNAHFYKVLQDPAQRPGAVAYLRSMEPGMAHLSDDEIANETIKTSGPLADPGARQKEQDSRNFAQGMKSFGQVRADIGRLRAAPPGAATPEAIRRAAASDEDPSIGSARVGGPEGIRRVDDERELHALREKSPKGAHTFVPKFSQQEMLLDDNGQPIAIMDSGATQSGQGINLANATGQNSYAQNGLALLGYGAANLVAGKDIGEGRTLGQRGLRELGGDVGSALAERPIPDTPEGRRDVGGVRQHEAAVLNLAARGKAGWDELQAKGWKAGAEAMASSEPGAVSTGVIGSTLGNVMGGAATIDELEAAFWKRQAEISKPAEGEEPGWIHSFNADMAKDNEDEAKSYRGIQSRMQSPSGAADVMRYWGDENTKDAADYRLMAQHAADTHADIEAAQSGAMPIAQVQDMQRASYKYGGQEIGELASAAAPTDVSLPGIFNKALKLAAPTAHGAAKAGAEVLGETVGAGRKLGGLAADAPFSETVSDISHVAGTRPVAQETFVAANAANKGTSQLRAFEFGERGKKLIDDGFADEVVPDTRWFKQRPGRDTPTRGVTEAEKQDALRGAFEVWHDAALRRQAPPRVQKAISILQPFHEDVFKQAKAAGNIPASVQYNPLHLDYGQNFSLRAKMDVSNASRRALSEGKEAFLERPYGRNDPQLDMTPGLEKYYQREGAEALDDGVRIANARGAGEILEDRVKRLTNVEEYGVRNKLEAAAFANKMKGLDAYSGIVEGGRIAAQHTREGPLAAAAVIKKDLDAMRDEAKRNITSYKRAMPDGSTKDVIAAPDYEPLNSTFSEAEQWGGAIKNADGTERGAARAQAMAKSYVDDNALKVMLDEANALDKEFNAARKHADRLRLAEDAESLKRVALDRTEAAAGKRLQTATRVVDRTEAAQAVAEGRLNKAGAKANAPMEMQAWLKSGQADDARAALEGERAATISNVQDTYRIAEEKADLAQERAATARLRYNKASENRKSVLGKSQEQIEKADMEAREIFARNRSQGILHEDVIRDLVRSDSVLVRLRSHRGPIDADLGNRVMEIPEELAFLDGYKIPRHDAEAMLQVTRPVAERKSTQWKKTAQAVDSVLGLGQMKRLITQGNMGFEARNIMGNIMRVASNDPDAITSPELRNMVARISNAGLDSGEVVRIGEEAFTLGQLKKMMIRDAGVGMGSMDRMLAQEGVTPGIGSAAEWATSAPFGVAERALGGKAGALAGKAKTAVPAGLNWASRAVVAPGAAVNAGADSLARTIFSHGKLEKLNPAFNTDDGLRMLAVLGGMKRGMSSQVAIRQMKHLLIDYSSSSALKEAVGSFVPFIKYYTGAFQGAAHLAIKQPRRYARFADAMRMMENLDRSVNREKTIDPRTKPLLDRVSFNPTITADGGQPMQLRFEHHGAEIANQLAMIGGTDWLPDLPFGLEDLTDDRGIAGTLAPYIGTAYAAATGVDAQTGNSIYGMSPDEVKSWPAGAYDQFKGAYKEQTEQGINNLGKYPELNAGYAALKYMPGLGGRFLPPQADALWRMINGGGHSPASKSTDGQASAFTRAAMGAIGARSTVKNLQTQFAKAQKKRAESIPPPLNIIGAKKR